VRGTVRIAQPDTRGVADYLAALGHSFLEAKDPDEARRAFSHCLTLDSTHVMARNDLGRMALSSKCPLEAERIFREILNGNAENPGVQINLSIALTRQGRFDEALEVCRRATRLSTAWVQMACIHNELMDYDEEALDYEQGLAIEPGNHFLLFGRAHLRLLRGEWTEGWKDYEHRPTRRELAGGLGKAPLWDGSPLEGRRLLVCGEQGAGDQIMFWRYVEALRAQGEVFLFTRPELEALAAPLATGVGSREGQRIDFEAWAPLCSLPLLTGRLEPWEPVESYIRLERGKIEQAAKAFRKRNGKLRVGLCWAGNNQHARDAMRSMPPESLAPILGNENYEFYSLQYGEEVIDTRLIDLSSRMIDFADTAAMISQLDLVISVDTAVAHLAGAMGKPTWLLAYVPHEWRWGLSSESSPWYKSIRIFRQSKPGEWRDVIDRVCVELGSSAVGLHGRT